MHSIGRYPEAKWRELRYLCCRIRILAACRVNIVNFVLTVFGSAVPESDFGVNAV